MRKYLPYLFLAFLPWTAKADSPTTITDTLHLPSGPVAAKATIYVSLASPFVTSGGTNVVAISAASPLEFFTNSSGVFSFTLWPNVGGTPSGTSYYVCYSYGPPCETWVVPVSASPVGLSTVRTIPTPNVLYTGPDWVSNLLNKPVFDIRSYGASTANAASVNTTAINAAMTAAAAAGGGTVIIPPGAWPVASGLVCPVSTSGVTLTGQGATLSVSETSTTDLLTINTYCTASYFNVLGFNKTVGYTVKVVYNSYWITVDHINAIGMPFGVYMPLCTTCFIEDSQFSALQPGTGYGVRVDAGNEILITRVVMANNVAPYPAACFLIDSGETQLFEVQALGCVSGLQIFSGASIESYHSFYDSNHGFGVNMSNSGGVGIFRFRSVGDWFGDTYRVNSGNPGYGFYAINVGGTIDDLIISDCKVSNNAAQGIYLYGVTNAVISNCTVTNNGYYSNNTLEGLGIYGPSAHVKINGGIYGNLPSSGNTGLQSYGMVFASTGGYVTASNADVCGNATSGVSLAFSGTGFNSLTNLTCYNPVGPGSVSCSNNMPCPSTPAVSPSVMYAYGGSITACSLGGTQIGNSASGCASVPLSPNGQVTYTFTGSPTFVQNVQ